MLRPICLFTGNANPPLAEGIAKHLDKPLARAKVQRFSDGETAIEVGENVRGIDTFIIQPTSQPANDSLMEILILSDALRRASAGSITAVMPYFGYARQDRIVNPGDSVGGLLVGTMLEKAGAKRIISVDFHSLALMNKFPLEHVNLTAESLFAKRFQELLSEKKIPNENVVLVSTDHGGLQRVAEFAANFKGAATAYADKFRPHANAATVQAIHGEVKGKLCIIFDDMIDTAGTLHEVAKALFNEGATDVWVSATHGIFSGEAMNLIKEAGIKTLLVSDTIEQPLEIGEVVSIAPLIADFILNDAELID